ncbi:hypothetical protein BDW22DRAFT_1347265 [Trametopsis cervina]|nr:hypothetical protein BDW22DRAFT_1347265 [Trametopsis cervina]
MPRGTASTRSRGKGRGRGASANSTSSVKRGRKTVIESEEETGSIQNGSEVEDSDVDNEYTLESVNNTPKPRKAVVVIPSRVKSTKSTPEWVSLEAKEDNEVSDTEEEEEDQLNDEGDEVGSDIGRVSEPEDVAFVRPSTSPIRKTKWIPVRTPPTPSPKKSSGKKTLKRDSPARPSLDSNNDDLEVKNEVTESEFVGSDNQEVDVEATPSTRKSKRAKYDLFLIFIVMDKLNAIYVRRPVKSAAYIEDSEIEEIDSEEYESNKKAIKASQNTPVPKSSARQAVTIVSRKISVAGIKKFPHPIEDVANNPLLDAKKIESSLPRSPKKKTKTVHVPSESEYEEVDCDDPVEEEVDDHLSLKKTKGKQPATPMSRLATKLNKSTLESAQKGRQPALLKEVLVVQPLPIPDEDMVFADHGLMERMSPSLKDTYGGLPVARAIAHVVSTPCLSPMIYNPARCDCDQFHAVQREGQYRDFQYFVTENISKSPNWNKNDGVCFVFWGSTFASNLVKGTSLGSGTWMLKGIGISPIVVEFHRTVAFLSIRMGFHEIYLPNYGGVLNFATRPGPANGISAPPPRSRHATEPEALTMQGSASVDYHRVIPYERKVKEFDDELRKNIQGYGVRGHETVPIYDLTAHFKDSYDQVYDHSIHRLLALAPRFEGDLPDDAVVGILALPQMTKHKVHEEFNEFRMNLVGIIVLAVPFM